jgi:hypothetical protein
MSPRLSDESVSTRTINAVKTYFTLSFSLTDTASPGYGGVS